MKNSILIASLFAVALAACSKKEETVAPAEPSSQSVIIEQAPAAAEPAPAEPMATEPAAAEPMATEPADATVPAEEEKK